MLYVSSFNHCGRAWYFEIALQKHKALRIDRTQQQWVDLGIHNEVCLTRPETCGTPGGAISMWLKKIYSASINAIISTKNRGTKERGFLALHSFNNLKYICIFTARKRSLGQDNVFTPVCHSAHMPTCNGANTHPTDTPGQTLPGQTPLWQKPPSQADTSRQTSPYPSDTTEYGQQAGGTHPTGMHTC